MTGQNEGKCNQDKREAGWDKSHPALCCSGFAINSGAGGSNQCLYSLSRLPVVSFLHRYGPQLQ